MAETRCKHCGEPIAQPIAAIPLKWMHDLGGGRWSAVCTKLVAEPAEAASPAVSLPEREEAAGGGAEHNFENTVQPALNALSLEALIDLRDKISYRINELRATEIGKAETKGR